MDVQVTEVVTEVCYQPDLLIAHCQQLRSIQNNAITRIAKLIDVELKKHGRESKNKATTVRE